MTDLKGLRVVELGEGGERYLVEGTTDPQAARTALELRLGDDLADTGAGEVAAGELAAVDARADWWWQPGTQHDLELRNAHEHTPPEGAEVFAGVVFA